MLTFDTANLKIPFVFINKEMAKHAYMFNINGTVHGQPVFSDGIFYILKGGKLVNCVLGRINGHLLDQVDHYLATGGINSDFPSSVHVKIRDLPKSFGCQVAVNPGYGNPQFMQLNRRIYGLVNDDSGNIR
jgi:hypothetical protein